MTSMPRIFMIMFQFLDIFCFLFKSYDVILLFSLANRGEDVKLIIDKILKEKLMV